MSSVFSKDILGVVIFMNVTKFQTHASPHQLVLFELGNDRCCDTPVANSRLFTPAYLNLVMIGAAIHLWQTHASSHQLVLLELCNYVVIGALRHLWQNRNVL